MRMRQAVFLSERLSHKLYREKSFFRGNGMRRDDDRRGLCERSGDRRVFRSQSVRNSPRRGGRTYVRFYRCSPYYRAQARFDRHNRSAFGDVRQIARGSGRHNRTQCPYSAFGNDGGHGCGGERTHGLRASVRSVFLYCGHTCASPRKPRIACRERCRRSVYNSRDLADMCVFAVVRRSVRLVEPSSLSDIRFDESASVRRRTCTADGNDKKADIRGKRTFEYAYSRNDAAYLLCASRRAVARASAPVACARYAGDLYAVCALSCRIYIHHASVGTQHVAKLGGGKRRRHARYARLLCSCHADFFFRLPPRCRLLLSRDRSGGIIVSDPCRAFSFSA